MLLQELELHHFRLFQFARLTLSSRIAVLVGKNGQGKTSVLEAIYLLAHSRSFRESHSRELIRWHQENELQPLFIKGNLRFESFVEATLTSEFGKKTISYGFEHNRRRVFLNDKPLDRASSFFGQAMVLEFTPEELQLVKGEPSERRTYLDKVLSLVDRSYVDHFISYQRALKNRNVLLREMREGEKGLSAESHEKLLEPWNVALAEHGTVLCAKRRALIRILQESAKEHYAHFLALQPRQYEREKFSLRLKSDFLSDSDDVLSFQQILQNYERLQSREIAAAKTLFGVQRDDIEMFLNFGSGEKDARVGASQGQARSVAIAMKLGAIDFVIEQSGEAPILLLDDVESELDQDRKNALYKTLIDDLNCQIIVTSTEFSRGALFGKNDVEILEINQGEILARNNQNK